MRPFINLTHLEVTDADDFDVGHMVDLLEGQKANLNYLSCTVTNYNSTSYVPNEKEFEKLDSMYDTLQNSTLKDGLNVFLHGVQLNEATLKKKHFDFFDFNQKLVKIHKHHYSTLYPRIVESSRSVTETEYVKDVLDLFNNLQPSDFDSMVSIVNPAKFGFSKFCQFYPNIQKIVLNNKATSSTENRQTQVEEKKFLDFLSCCQGISELHLLSSDFGDFFYDKAWKMGSLKYLHTLIIIEPCLFSKRVDFSFLQKLPYLEKFYSNIVTR